jgi:hypothetical protein
MMKGRNISLSFYEANGGFFVWRKVLTGTSGFYSLEIYKKRL